MSTTIKDLATKLHQLFINNKLGHFYIIKDHPMSENSENNTQEFIVNFFSLVLKKKVNLENLLSNPDILILGNDIEVQDQYKVENIEELFSFNELAPMNIGHKFILFYHAQKIGPIILNKLLKILEEPNKKTTIFFVLDVNQKLLPTIESRSLSIRLPLEKAPKDEDQIKTNYPSIATAIEQSRNKEIKLDEEVLLQNLKATSNSPKNYAQLEELLKLVQWNKESQSYRNSANERIFENIVFSKKT